MKKQHAFRPALSDILEDRLVLSHAHASARTATVQQIRSFQGIQLESIQNQINAAFANFALDYSQVQANYLAQQAGSPAATIDGLHMFTTNRVSTLVQQLNGIIGTMPKGSPAASAAITNPLGGSGAGTLVTRLNSISAVGTNGETAAQFAQDTASSIELGRSVTSESFRLFGNAANAELFNQFQSQNNPRLNTRRMSRAQWINLARQTETSGQVQQAFNTFFNNFSGARTNTLFNATTGTGAGGTINFGQNQANFNTAFNNSLNTLGFSLASSLGTMRGANNSLVPSIVQGLFGAPSPTGTGFATPGVLGQLASLQAPTDFTGLSAAQFNNTAFDTLNTAFQNVSNRFAAFTQNPNANFSSFNSFGGNSPFSPVLSSNGFFNGGGFNNTGLGNPGFNSNPFPFGASPNFSTGFGSPSFISFSDPFQINRGNPFPFGGSPNGFGGNGGFGASPNSPGNGNIFGGSPNGSGNGFGGTGPFA